MPRQILTVLFCAICLCSFSQPQKFVINKIKVRSFPGGKETIDGTKRGFASINFEEHFISLRYGSTYKLFYFNTFYDILGKQDSFINCQFKYISLPKKEDRISLYFDVRSDLSTEWMIVHNEKNIETQYYIELDKEDKEFDSYGIFSYINNSLGNIKFDWDYLTSSSEGALWFVRAEPLKNDKTIEVWIKQLIPTFKYKSITYNNVEAKIIMKFDCANRELYTGDQHYYNNKGTIITSEPDYGDGWQRVIPETVGEIVLDKICQFFKK